MEEFERYIIGGGIVIGFILLSMIAYIMVDSVRCWLEKRRNK